MLIIISLLAAIIMFLFGLELMSEGLKQAAEKQMQHFFQKALRHPVIGALVGLVVTLTIQSSSATTSMVVGFVNSGLMTLLQAAGVIIGANLGSAISSQIVAFNFNDFVPWFIVIGGVLFLFQKAKQRRNAGKIILGFGFMFMGLMQMGQVMAPLAESDFFRQLIIGIEGHLLLGVLIGTIMTAILQSSTASIAILVSLSGYGYLNSYLALPLIFGINIGSCVTALIASISTSKAGKAAALIHLLFALIGTLIFLPFIGTINNIILLIGGTDARMVANSHTLFNILTAIVLLPFSRYLVWLAQWLTKERKSKT